MIKECNIIRANEFVTVVDFDGRYVQLPAIDGKHTSVLVSYENDRYTIIENSMSNDIDDHKKQRVKTQRKKTTTESNELLLPEEYNVANRS